MHGTLSLPYHPSYPVKPAPYCISLALKYDVCCNKLFLNHRNSNMSDTSICLTDQIG